MSTHMFRRNRNGHNGCHRGRLRVRQSLAVARAVIARPKLLLLNEPTLGLSPRAASGLLATIGRLTNGLGMTVLLAEQNVGLAPEVCDKGWWLDAGRVMSQVEPGGAADRR
jgi:branched-chain amino acid transport system ATP-binding protein